MQVSKVLSSPGREVKYGFSGFMTTNKQTNKKRNKGERKTKEENKHDMIIIIIVIITVLIGTIPQSTTNIHIHHFKTTLMCPRSIAGVPFDSVEILRTTFVLCTNCMHSYYLCIPPVIGELTVWRHTKTKNHI